MSFLESICAALEEGKKLALVSVVEQSASSPRHAGAAMLVGEQGLIAGTVGGGAMEASAIETGKRVIEEGKAEFVDFDLTNEDAANSDMICGGKMRLFAEPLLPNVASKALFHRLRMAAGMGDDMVCIVPVKAPAQRRLCKLSAKEWPVPVELRERIREHELSCPFVVTTSDNLDFVILPWLAPWRLIIAGGGHVARATATIASSVGFCVSILDDREEFASKERFPEATITRVVPEYQDCFAGFHTDDKSFIAIMTRGHLFDRVVLAQALSTKAGYIGMIGSKKKTAMLFDKLKEEGVTEEALQKVVAPIGLSIGAETPEEIAVSILGQLIAVRAKKSGSAHHLDEALLPKEKTV